MSKDKQKIYISDVIKEVSVESLESALENAIKNLTQEETQIQINKIEYGSAIEINLTIGTKNFNMIDFSWSTLEEQEKSNRLPVVHHSIGDHLTNTIIKETDYTIETFGYFSHSDNPYNRTICFFTTKNYKFYLNEKNYEYLFGNLDQINQENVSKTIKSRIENKEFINEVIESITEP